MAKLCMNPQFYGFIDCSRCTTQNICLSIAGERLTKRLRLKSFQCMLKQACFITVRSHLHVEPLLHIQQCDMTMPSHALLMLTLGTLSLPTKINSCFVFFKCIQLLVYGIVSVKRDLADTLINFQYVQ